MGGSGSATVEDVPGGEMTQFQGTYQISAGQFLMTLEPSTPNYDGHSHTKAAPNWAQTLAGGTDSGMVSASNRGRATD